MIDEVIEEKLESCLYRLFQLLEELSDGDIFVFQKSDASTADLPNCKEHFR